MRNVATLHANSSCELQFWHSPNTSIGHLLENQWADVAIMSTEDGFSPIGGSSRILSAELGVPASEIRRLADWNRFVNERVTLVGIQSRRLGSRLKGLVLAPGETARCYERFATPHWGRPYRDFYYNVMYEALGYVLANWGARHVAVSHLSGCNNFHEDIAKCTTEAAAHLKLGLGGNLESLVFFECCISEQSLLGVPAMALEATLTSHREISTVVEATANVELVHISWQTSAQRRDCAPAPLH